MREAKAILRFVDDLKRACSMFVDAQGDYSCSKSFNNVIFPVDFSGLCVCLMKLLLKKCDKSCGEQNDSIRIHSRLILADCKCVYSAEGTGL